MPYATREDMIARFGEAELIQISDREGMGVINDDVFAQAQLDGDAEIDPYLRSQYQLPLASVPTNLIRIACDIYRYYMYGNLVPDYAEKRYKQAIATLKLINSGDIDLNLNQQGAPVPESQIHTKAGIAAPVFNEQRLRNF